MFRRKPEAVQPLSGQAIPESHKSHLLPKSLLRDLNPLRKVRTDENDKNKMGVGTLVSAEVVMFV